MTDDSLLPFDLPGVQRKKVSTVSDGGLISSDGGLVLLREAERNLRLAETLAGCIRDRRNHALVAHSISAPAGGAAEVHRSEVIRAPMRRRSRRSGMSRLFFHNLSSPSLRLLRRCPASRTSRTTGFRHR